jgi:hypothetical protein
MVDYAAFASLASISDGTNCHATMGHVRRIPRRIARPSPLADPPAASEAGTDAVVMPTTAPAVKVEGCKSYGAEVIMEGTTSLDRQARAEKETRERGLTIAPSKPVTPSRWIPPRASPTAS